MQHTITAEQAYTIDNEWMNAGQPSDGLRLVDYRISGNKRRTFLTVPGDDTAPLYERTSNGFVHISGPQIRMTPAQYRAIYEAPGAEYEPLPI